MMNFVETETIYVRYLGNKPQKYDTIFGTPTVWTPGAVRRLQVPRGHKVRMLQHQDVWEEIIEGEKEEEPESKKALFAKARKLGIKAPFNITVQELQEKIAAHDHNA